MRCLLSNLIAFMWLASVAIAVELAPWPQANGPFGNFNPRQYDLKLVDDPAQAKLEWTSEFHDLGFAKGSSSGFLRHLADPTTHPGSASGLIVAEGKVFASSFRPRGEIWAEKMPHLATPGAKALLDDPVSGPALRHNSAVDADDLTVAIDLRTGKTIWTAIEEGAGLNRYSGKRLQFHGTPVYHDGCIFSLGSAGHVYCYEAATGKKLWQESESLLVKYSADKKRLLLEARDGIAGGQGMASCPVVAGGILVVPEFDSPQDISLRGLESKSGKTLWKVPACCCRYATPAVWTKDKQQYIVVATQKGELRLIDPRAGKVLWTVTGLEPNYYSLTTTPDHVFVNVKSATPSAKKEKQSWGRMAAYKLGLDKAELAWSVPDQAEYWFENHMDICAMRRILARDGRVYYFTQGHTLDAAQSATFFSIFDEATGKPLYTSKPGEFGHASTDNPQRSILGQFWLVEDRILNIPDAAHSERSTINFLTADPANIKRLGGTLKLAHHNTTAYEVFIELPYVDGRFLMRTWQGQVVCYDFRKHH